ncbi:hypothetical protein D3C75_1015630 [compost metagenome]
MKLEDKIKILKEHQIYCYQVCLCLLHEQRVSEEAASVALLDIAQTSDFFTVDHTLQRVKIRQAAIKASKKIKTAMRSTA